MLPTTASVLRVLAQLSFANLRAFPLECICAELSRLLKLPIGRLGAPSLLQSASLGPVLLIAVLCLSFGFRSELLALVYLPPADRRARRDLLRRLALTYWTLAWITAAVVVGGVSQLALSAFQCVDIDPDHIFSSSAAPALMMWCEMASFIYPSLTPSSLPYPTLLSLSFFLSLSRSLI